MQHSRNRMNGLFAAVNESMFIIRLICFLKTCWHWWKTWHVSARLLSAIHLIPSKVEVGLNKCTLKRDVKQWLEGDSVLPFVLWSIYSRRILINCTRVRINAPNAKEPTWYLKGWKPGCLSVSDWNLTFTPLSLLKSLLSLRGAPSCRIAFYSNTTAMFLFPWVVRVSGRQKSYLIERMKLAPTGNVGISLGLVKAQ